MLNPIWNALIFFSTAHNQQLYAHAPKNGFTISSCHHIHHWLVVWKYEFYFSIYWESSSRLTFIFFRGAGTPPTSCYHAISTLWYIWYCKEWCIYYIYICIYMHWSYSSFFHHLISMSEASAGNQATTCSIHRWGPPGQPGIAGSKKWGTQRMSKVYSSIPWEFLYVFMICEQMYDNWHWGYVHEVVYLCLFSGTLCPSGS